MIVVKTLIGPLRSASNTAPTSHTGSLIHAVLQGGGISVFQVQPLILGDGKLAVKPHTASRHQRQTELGPVRPKSKLIPLLKKPLTIVEALSGAAELLKVTRNPTLSCVPAITPYIALLDCYFWV